MAAAAGTWSTIPLLEATIPSEPFRTLPAYLTFIVLGRKIKFNLILIIGSRQKQTTRSRSHIINFTFDISKLFTTAKQEGAFNTFCVFGLLSINEVYSHKKMIKASMFLFSGWIYRWSEQWPRLNPATSGTGFYTFTICNCHIDLLMIWCAVETGLLTCTCFLSNV